MQNTLQAIIKLLKIQKINSIMIENNFSSKAC